jgi:hypothetical protein
LIPIKEGTLPNDKKNFKPSSAITAKNTVTRIYSHIKNVTSRGSVIGLHSLAISAAILLLSGLAGAQGGPPSDITNRFGGGGGKSSQQPPQQQSGQYQQPPQQQPGMIQQQPGQYRQPMTQQPPGQYQQSPQQQPGIIQQQPGQYRQPMTQQPPGQYQQPPQQQPGMIQQQPGQYRQPMAQQAPAQYQQSPQQQQRMIQQQPGQYRQPMAQQAPAQYQQPPPPVRKPLPVVISGKIKIEGVKTILQELLPSEEGREWQLKAYIGEPPNKIYLSNLKWTVKPDDETFDVLSYDPQIAVIRLKNKKNIWADPKLKMVTKEYVFHAQAQGKSGGIITSIDSILFAQCAYPVEFYTADKQPFNYPSGYKYRISLQKENGKFVDYKEYDELGKLTVDLQEKFKERVIFRWNENTAGKSTTIKLEIMEDDKVLVEKIQKMTSTCRNITDQDTAASSLAQNTSGSGTNIAHPSFSWHTPIYRKLDDSDLFQIILENFKLTNPANIDPNVFNARNYFLETRFYHQDFQEGKDPPKAYQANQFFIVTKILPPHLDNRSISLRGKTDDFSRMGYILEDNPGKWYDGYLKLHVIFDSIPMETIYVSPPYPCRYKYHEGIFSKDYVFEMMGEISGEKKTSPAVDEKKEQQIPQADEKPEKE